MSRSPTLSAKVADLLQEMIAGQQLAPGDKLPSERELGERLGVSRTVVREAVRALVAKGLLAQQGGRGLVVARVNASAVRDSMNLFLRSRVLNRENFAAALRQLHEVRSMIEVEVAGVAAERATDEEAAALREAAGRLQAATDDEERSLADVEFHREIAKLTHNELYLVLLDAIRDPLTDIRRATYHLPNRIPDAVAGHERITERIAAHDAEGARDAMREHLEESARALERVRPEHLEIAAGWTSA